MSEPASRSSTQRLREAATERKRGRSSRERLVVDPVRCTAAGLCAELLPEVVRLDEWGYPVVEDLQLDGRTLRLARRAAAACPVRALLLLDARP